jgi:hypothetical protein
LPFLQGCFFPLEDTAARNFFLTATTQFVFNFCVDF